MKSIFKRSLAIVMVLAMLLTMALPAFAAGAVHKDNTPCEHAGTEHDKTEEVKATCAAPGGIWHTCDLCGDVWVTDQTPIDTVNGHNWSEAQDVEATCQNNKRLGTQTCDVPGCPTPTRGGEEIPGTQYNHIIGDPMSSMVLDAENSDTLTDCLSGGVFNYKCEFCDHTETVTPDADGHTHKLRATGYQAPTCTDKGWVTIDCELCDEGDNVKVWIAALGHDFVYQPEVPSQCNVAGYHEGAYCAREWLLWDENGVATKVTCSAFYKGTDPSAVEFDTTDRNAESLRHTGAAMHGEMIKATEEYTNGELSYKAATCNPNVPGEEQKGWQYWVCEHGCGYFEKQELTATHDTNNDIPERRQEATCTEDGWVKKTCNICEQWVTVEVLPAGHQYAGSGDVIYTFLKDGKVYIADNVADVELRYTSPLTYKLDFKPYMADDLTDAKAIALINAGYKAIEWTVSKEATCGEKGNYMHSCSVCDEGEFMIIETQHTWNGVLLNNGLELAPSCTEPGGYLGACNDCGHEYLLSVADFATAGQEVPEGYTGPKAALQHKTHAGTSAGMAGTTFIKPSESAQASTCIVLGWNAFEYCDRADCSENLPSYEEALAANRLTEYAEHKYYGEGNVVLNPITVQPNCAYLGYQIAGCAVCDKPLYDNDTVENAELAWNNRIGANTLEDTYFGSYDENVHVWPTGDFDGDGERDVATPPTCAKPGEYVVIQCPLCGELDKGDEIPALNPGTKPVYSVGMTDSEDDGWKVVVTESTCAVQGGTYIYCEYCEENGTTTHATAAAPELLAGSLQPLADHMIAGAEYVKNADGTYKMDGTKYVVVGSSLTGLAVDPPEGQIEIYQEGTCDTLVNRRHKDWYTCAGCEQVMAFEVRVDHVMPNAEDLMCGETLVCEVCEKPSDLANPVVAGHNFVKGALIGDDQDCTTAKYYEIECSKCHISSDDDDWTWTEEYKLAAEYVEAQEHVWDIDAPTCELGQECTNEGCEQTGEDALGHNITSDYEPATCNRYGYTTYKCANGASCDHLTNDTGAELEGEFAVWTVEDVAGGYGAHVMEKVDSRTMDCLGYGAELWRCVNCAKDGKLDKTEYAESGDGYEIRNFVDTKGHVLVNHGKAPECVAKGEDADGDGIDDGYGYDWYYCACYDPEDADGLWTELDWEGKDGYNDKVEIAPEGHYYLDENNEKVFFQAHCQLIVDHLDENGEVKCDGFCQAVYTQDNTHAITKEYVQETTCTVDGLVWKYCSNENCGWKSILSVEYATGHDALYWRDVTPATCCATGTAVLACASCNQDVKVGETINGLLPDEVLEEGEEFVPYAATAEMLEKEIPCVPHQWSIVEDECVEATIHTPGLLVEECIYNANNHDCQEKRETELEKTGKLEFSTSVDNAVKPGHKVYVNGGTIAYTISIDGEEKAIYGITLNVKYDTNKLTYVGFDLGADKANLFGTLDANGTCATMAGSSAPDASGMAVVTVLAQNPNTAAGSIADVTVDEKTEFVTLYFKVNADTITAEKLSTSYETSIELLDDMLISKADATVYDADLAVDEEPTLDVKNAGAILIQKLGDVNVATNPETGALIPDNLVNMLDAQAIQALILKGDAGYDARADINQDGAITSADMIAVQRFIIHTLTYAEMVNP